MDLLLKTRRPSPRLRLEASVLKAIAASCLFHALLLGSIIFSFHVRPWNPRPFFVFLGSILQEQDFWASTLDRSLATVDIRVYETSALPTGWSSPGVSVTKPSLPNKLPPPGKILWKPVLAQEISSGIKEGESPLQRDVGRDFDIPAYVPLKFSPSSPKLRDLRRGEGGQ